MTVSLFIATSLDGYLAGPDDDLSWLFTEADNGFSDFYETVDSLIMGRGTYDVIRRFGKWPYPGKSTTVVSRKGNLEIDTPDTALHTADLSGLIRTLEASDRKNVWLVGGVELIRSFLEQGLLDRITVSVQPILLGNGIPLFPGGFPRTVLMLEDAQAFEDGLVQLNYHILPADDGLD